MAFCPISEGLVHGLIDTVDCNVRTLAQDSYRELVGPGTMFAAAFTGLLTLYIALIGYQLLLGRGHLRLTQLPVTGLKIGLIMAFLTSWAAYQTVIFNFLFDGPREILAALLRPMGWSGFDGDIYDGIENAYTTLSSVAETYGGQASPTANILQGGPMLGAGLLWMAGVGLLLTTIGVILAAKIVLGFLLAIGPIFIALFLFDTTRGFFDGWLRATVAFALAPLAANVFGGAMLIMLTPFLAVLAHNASLDVFDMGPIVATALIVTVFALVMVMTLRVTATIAAGFATSVSNREKAQSASAPVSNGFGHREDAPAVAERRAMRIEVERTARLSRQVDVALSESWSGDGTSPEHLGQTYRRRPRALRQALGEQT